MPNINMRNIPQPIKDKWYQAARVKFEGVLGEKRCLTAFMTAAANKYADEILKQTD